MMKKQGQGNTGGSGKGGPAKPDKAVEVVKAPAVKDGQAAPAPDPAALAQAEAANLTLLGQATWLMSLSSPHKHLFLSDLEWRTRPPLLLRQCRLVQRDGRPFAYVTWAYVTDEIIARLRTQPGRLQPNEWRSGKKVVIVDVVAPFGGAEACLKEAQRAALKALEAPAAKA
jgi:cytolysin-activating lysine-acyltransferase